MGHDVSLSERRDKMIGRPIDEITTPALVADVDAVDANLGRMAEYFAGRPCKLRPHFKSHKCVTLARRQLEAGSAVGITCAKVSEAEALVAGGIEDVLIANQVIGAEKTERLARLNHGATVRCAVDCRAGVSELAAAARRTGVTIGILVETDVGMGRCGVAPGEPTLKLARAIAAADGLRFDGLQGFEGHLVMLPDRDERGTKVLEAMQSLVETRRMLADAGLAGTIVSSGGTGTYDITGNIDGIDEIQAGAYALMDHGYWAIRPEFLVARVVLATVVSARPGRAILDVGVKGLGCEFGVPVISGCDEVNVIFCAEEHTTVDNLSAAVGDRVHVVPSHGCTTNNLYRCMWIARDGLVEDCWAIEGAGALE